MTKYCYENCEVTSKRELNKMVQCEGECSNWFHYVCVGIKTHREAREIENWFCKNCQSQQPTSEINRDLSNEEIRSHQQTITKSPPQLPVPDISLRPVLTPNSQANRNNTSSESSQGIPPTNNTSQNEIDENYIPPTPRFERHSQGTAFSQTNSTGTDGGNDDDEPIPEDHFIVEKILAHHKIGRTLEYKIRWKGEAEAEDRWLLEKDLESCYQILSDYKTKNNLGQPTIPKPKYGASGAKSVPYNERNWASMEDIIKSIQTYSCKTYENKIEVQPFQKLSNRDTIYLVPIGNHVIVGIHFASVGKIYIADGGNLFRDHQRIQHQVKEKLGHNLSYTAVDFYRQRAVDFCASSAASIAIEFRRLYGTGEEIPAEIMVERFTQLRISSKLHKEQSESLHGFRPVQGNITENRCPTCGKRYVNRNRSAFLAHTRLCT